MNEEFRILMGIAVVFGVGFAIGSFYGNEECEDINCFDSFIDQVEQVDQARKVFYQYRPETTEDQVVWKFSAKANETIELRIAEH